MNLLSLRIRNSLVICFLVNLFFYCNFSLAQDVIERDYHNLTYSSLSDSEDFSYSDSPEEKKSVHKSQSPFVGSDAVTFKTLLVKVSALLFVLLTILAMIKVFLSRNKFSRVGSIFDEFTQKITGGLSNYVQVGGLKLKQTLTLAPGQNIYLVEIDGKKLLLGATHHGGVHFLADLTCEESKNYKHIGIFPAKQLEECQSDIKDNHPFVTSTMTNSMNHSDRSLDSNGASGLRTVLHNQPLKRRVNFKQSLLNEV